MANTNNAGAEALRRLKEVDPPSLLAPNPTLSETARAASQYLFSSIRPFSQKCPLDQLLVDGYDAEQIWHQIDLQTQPLLSTLRRRVNQFVKNPDEIAQLKVPSSVAKKVEAKNHEEWEQESDDFDEELDEDDDDEDDFEGVEKEEKNGGSDGEEEDDDDDDDEEGSEDEDEDEEGEKEKGKGKDSGIEDKFLKINELNEYLEKEENNYENAEEADDGDEDSEEDDELEKAGEFEMDEDDEDDDEEEDEDDEEEEEGMENARYDDFFVGKKEKSSKRKDQLVEESEDSGDEDDMESNKQVCVCVCVYVCVCMIVKIFILKIKFSYPVFLYSFMQKKRTASTHEKQLEKIQSEIELMEKANVEPKTWSMQGEVTAANRPVDSLLAVNLDFEHNVRPTPVITEEFTASIEEMIQKRIIEGLFNDVQRAPRLPSKAPREVKELDDNKSKKGLAEMYEQEYVQKIDPTSAPLSSKDKLKNEASMLFKRLCLKLDALSHFSFAPKPVIEDMSFQTNVPALAMEEIAPVAVSDAAMLAPEEVFDGKGDVKEEAELTQAERKRRRANKKRKFKADAVKRSEKKARSEKKEDNAIPGQVNG
ncbi:U3 small nucleolar ribonucleoprotein protein MPP10 isoform X1 [Trifolium pratense]|uniref:U3 small nucleolar ribonucleoprotein protein MPP10 isoform X1 n=1 Tax=Trifolium pratense TaxID=57577 RepID=UPI001E6902F0|nr:U3 small nucleolar ribonucleoprotein protein MPP10 isoform X1 [Trifolium pratense]